jgi:hypothetical protein
LKEKMTARVIRQASRASKHTAIFHGERAQTCGNAALAHCCRRNLENKILLAAQTLLYLIHIDSHLDTEGGWSIHGNEESSNEEAGKEGG